jgi:hypothetical protein
MELALQLHDGQIFRACWPPHGTCLSLFLHPARAGLAYFYRLATVPYTLPGAVNLLDNRGSGAEFGSFGLTTSATAEFPDGAAGAKGRAGFVTTLLGREAALVAPPKYEETTAQRT